MQELTSKIRRSLSGSLKPEDAHPEEFEQVKTFVKGMVPKRYANSRNDNAHLFNIGYNSLFSDILKSYFKENLDIENVTFSFVEDGHDEKVFREVRSMIKCRGSIVYNEFSGKSFEIAMNPWSHTPKYLDDPYENSCTLLSQAVLGVKKELERNVSALKTHLKGAHAIVDLNNFLVFVEDDARRARVGLVVYVSSFIYSREAAKIEEGEHELRSNEV